MRTKRIFFVLIFLIVFVFTVFVPVTVGYAQAAEIPFAAEEEAIQEIEPEAEKDWGDWIKNELVPYAILAITAISTIIIAVSPILAKVKQASDKFKSAASDVNRTAEEGNANTKKIEAFTEQTAKSLSEIAESFISQITTEGSANSKKIDAFTEQTLNKISEMTAKFVEQMKVLDDRVSRIEKISKNTERISRIAFGNTSELVHNGYAAEIEKVGMNDEQREEETKP